ncbi:MAG TPA: hypothetical protein VEX43_05275 [Chthoniobacterales bacterium]|nr:hypothetical protein [Chthoniobacterales bacterium]
MPKVSFACARSFRVVLLAAGIAAIALPADASVVNLGGPTTDWTPILYSSSNPDPSNDQQTGSTEGDIVGNAAHPSVYTAFGDAGTPSLTDGTLAFRIRLGADTNPGGFKTALFIYIDANADGKIDLFLGVNNSGSADMVGMWGAGSDLNISPSTTSISGSPLVSYAPTASNYYWSQVTSVNDPSVGTATDLDGGGQPDFFLGFALPFADVVSQLALLGITFDENSTLNYVIATATQANSLNQDLNGVDKNFNGALTWSQLGVLSNPMTPAGMAVVPEVSPALWVVLLLAALGAQRQIRNRKAARRPSVLTVGA